VLRSELYQNSAIWHEISRDAKYKIHPILQSINPTVHGMFQSSWLATAN